MCKIWHKISSYYWKQDNMQYYSNFSVHKDIYLCVFVILCVVIGSLDFPLIIHTF